MELPDGFVGCGECGPCKLRLFLHVVDHMSTFDKLVVLPLVELVLLTLVVNR